MMIKCLSSKYVSAFFFTIPFLPLILGAQPNGSPSNSLPVGSAKIEYLFPINPGKPGELAGTMGELRNTHFHSGIDVRTNNTIGAAVLAVQDGYISRVVKSSFSYGNVIYVTHPDGNTSLYAHLHELKGKLGIYVRQEQYNRHTFEIDLRFAPSEFPVSRGDTIALSGNTGSSNGPHLHFDIRDKEMNALNPLDFGYDEIQDNTKPWVQKIAFRTMDINSRINGQFGRFEFHALKVGNDYVLKQPILASGKIGVEVLAYDKMENSRFVFGISTIEMRADSQLVFRQHIDKITMRVTRGILAVFDYKTLMLANVRFNKLFVEDGNPFNFYEGTVNRGMILVDGKDVPVQIKLKDSYDNTTKVNFTFKQDPTVARIPSLVNSMKPLAMTIRENILQVTGKTCQDSTAKFYYAGVPLQRNPSYKGTGVQVYLVDLKKGVPDSVQSCGEKINFKVDDIVPSGTEYTYYNNHLSVFFPDSALFDTLYLSVTKKSLAKNETIGIGDKFVPLMRDVKIVWKPEQKYDGQKYSVYRLEGGGHYTNLGGSWENGFVTFFTRGFGEYTLLPDILPPTVARIALNQTYARFKINDNLSGINSFEASINGNWLLMNYDYKTGILFSEKLDKKIPFKGDFQLKVTDYSGNEKIFKQKIL